LENKKHQTSRKAPEHLAARENALNALHLGRVKHPTSAGKSATVATKPLRSHNLQDVRNATSLKNQVTKLLDSLDAKNPFGKMMEHGSEIPKHALFSTLMEADALMH
jgi:hypothetical protein